jgi:NDP-sugar pyrophosphorylase family protein
MEYSVLVRSSDNKVLSAGYTNFSGYYNPSLHYIVSGYYAFSPPLFDSTWSYVSGEFHMISEILDYVYPIPTLYDEIIRSGDKVSEIVEWIDSTKNIKNVQVIFNRVSGKISSVQTDYYRDGDLYMSTLDSIIRGQYGEVSYVSGAPL